MSAAKVYRKLLLAKVCDYGFCDPPSISCDGPTYTVRFYRRSGGTWSIAEGAGETIDDAIRDAIRRLESRA